MGKNLFAFFRHNHPPPRGVWTIFFTAVGLFGVVRIIVVELDVKHTITEWIGYGFGGAIICFIFYVIGRGVDNWVNR